MNVLVTSCSQLHSADVFTCCLSGILLSWPILLPFDPAEQFFKQGVPMIVYTTAVFPTPAISRLQFSNFVPSRDIGIQNFWAANSKDGARWGFWRCIPTCLKGRKLKKAALKQCHGNCLFSTMCCFQSYMQIFLFDGHHPHGWFHPPILISQQHYKKILTVIIELHTR